MADDVEFEWRDGQLRVPNSTLAGPSSDPEFTPRRFRRAPALIVLVIAVVVVVSVTALNTYRSRTVRDTRTESVLGSGANGVDPGGCPAGAQCTISGGGFLVASEATKRLFPGSIELIGEATAGVSSQYLRSTTMRTPTGLLITVSSQCLPGTDAVPSHTELIPPSRPTDVLIVLGGTGDCSITLSAHAAAGTVAPVTQLQQLAAAAQTN